jgi:hypothetical protein
MTEIKTPGKLQMSPSMQYINDSPDRFKSMPRAVKEPVKEMASVREMALNGQRIY